MRFINVIAGLAIAAAPLSGALARDEALAKAIGSSHRTPAMVERDAARKPQGELEFFGIRPDMTVVEIAPGSGYWTEILAPYLHDKGTLYIAIAPRTASERAATYYDGWKKKIDEKMVKRQQAILSSMTKAERKRPEIIKASRKQRIAAGSGTNVADVNKLLKQHMEMSRMMKQMTKLGKKGLMRHGLAGLMPRS